jgi:predicted DNA-binding ArsR family transcriptional regulator
MGILETEIRINLAIHDIKDILYKSRFSKEEIKQIIERLRRMNE